MHWSKNNYRLSQFFFIISAMSDYQRAANIDEHSQRAREGVKRAQKLQKQSKKRNYYQILGVPR